MPKFQWREPEMDWCSKRIAMVQKLWRATAPNTMCQHTDIEKELALLGRRPVWRRMPSTKIEAPEKLRRRSVSEAVLAALGA